MISYTWNGPPGLWHYTPAVVVSGAADQVRAQAIALPIERDLDRVDVPEVAHQIGPRNVDAPLVHTPLQVHLQPQRQEAGHDVPDARVVAVVEEGPELEGGLLLAE